MNKKEIQEEYNKIVDEVHHINERLVDLLNEIENIYGIEDVEILQNNEVWKQVSDTRNWNIYKKKQETPHELITLNF